MKREIMHRLKCPDAASEFEKFERDSNNQRKIYPGFTAVPLRGDKKRPDPMAKKATVSLWATRTCQTVKNLTRALQANG